MDWADQIAGKIGERCPELSPSDVDFIADTVRDRVRPILMAAQEAVDKGNTVNLANEIFGFNTDAYPSSQGDWEFERSSGYAGFRCRKCAVWVYASSPKECDCDKENP